MKTALIVVDMQNDFCPGGALAVTGGNEIVPLINRYMDKVDLVVATQDWHPENHCSFAANWTGKNPGEVVETGKGQQVLWPVHCVQNTVNADFVDGLDTERFATVIRKGVNPEIDSYSGFFDNNHEQKTGLDKYLQENNVTDLLICGLATDYCVKFTVLDALQLGYKVTLLVDASRGVDLNPGDVENAVAEMQKADAEVVA